jgi:hypothetical protein
MGRSTSEASGTLFGTLFGTARYSALHAIRHSIRHSAVLVFNQFPLPHSIRRALDSITEAI